MACDKLAQGSGLILDGQGSDGAVAHQLDCLHMLLVAWYAMKHFAVICKPANLINYHSRELPDRDVWGVLMRADDPLAEGEGVTATQLAKRSAYLSRQQVSMSHETNPFRNWLGRYRGRAKQVGTLDLVRNAGAMVAAGDALAVTFEGVGGYDTDDLTFRPFEPRLETASVFAWKRHRTFNEASRVFLDAMKAQLEG